MTRGPRRVCAQCGGGPVRPKRTYCSHPCAMEAIKASNRATKIANGRVCIRCGEVRAYGAGKFCSKRCWSADTNERHAELRRSGRGRTCRACGQYREPHELYVKYGRFEAKCRPCVAATWAQTSATRTPLGDPFPCNQCGKDFVRTHPSQLTCSHRCRLDRQRARGRAARRREAEVRLGGAEGTRRCVFCEKDLPVSAFYTDLGDRRSFHRTLCLSCRPHRMLRQRLATYGLSGRQYLDTIARQAGACLVCKHPTDVLVVDHRHADGVVRGLLCSPCNLAIGLLKEDPAALANAASYLIDFPGVVAYEEVTAA